MTKRTPVKGGSDVTLYVFLADAGICIEVTGRTPRNKSAWFGNQLSLNIRNCALKFTTYTGTRHVIYFPKADRTYVLHNFQINAYVDDCFVEFAGVTPVLHEAVPTSFAVMQPIDVWRLMRMPAPQTVAISWRITSVNISTLSLKIGSTEIGFRKGCCNDGALRDLDDYLNQVH